MQFNYKTPKPKKCTSFFAVTGEPDLAMPNPVLLFKLTICVSSESENHTFDAAYSVCKSYLFDVF